MTDIKKDTKAVDQVSDDVLEEVSGGHHEASVDETAKDGAGDEAGEKGFFKFKKKKKFGHGHGGHGHGHHH